MAMAKGAPGDYQIKDSIAHLNGLQARLFDGAAAGVLTNEEAKRLAREFSVNKNMDEFEHSGMIDALWRRRAEEPLPPNPPAGPIGKRRQAYIG